MVAGSIGVWLALATGPWSSGAHPMHTAVVELVEQRPVRSVSLTIRVFADDFGTVVQGDSGPASETYLRSHLELSDAEGRPVRLRWNGVRRSGDVIEARFTAEMPGGLSRSRVRAAVLCERFVDQVDIVRASYNGRTASLLFTRGDAAKALP